jgi:hypothetical protein
MESALAASQKLSKLSQDLKSIVSRFNVEDESGGASPHEDDTEAVVT